MLGYFNFSITGLSHLEEKEHKVCQDENGVLKLDNGWIVAAIADGVGSAAHADIGAQIAVDTAINTMSGLIADYHPSWDPEKLKSFLKVTYISAMKNITDKAQKDKNPIADYETTLTTVIYNGSDIVFGQSGDGGILVLYNSGEVESITSVQKGNAFNEVVPLRAGENSWVFGASDKPIAALLMMTDGIYDVACPPVLAKTEQPVRINYVRQFMDRNLIPVENEQDFADLQAMAKEFYENPKTGSKKITDDKTMVGIINTEILPQVKEEAYYQTPDYASIREEQLKKLYEKSETQVREAEFRPSYGVRPPNPNTIQPHQSDGSESEQYTKTIEPEKTKEANADIQPSSADYLEQKGAVVLEKRESAVPIIDADEHNDSKEQKSSSDIIDADKLQEDTVEKKE